MCINLLAFNARHRYAHRSIASQVIYSARTYAENKIYAAENVLTEWSQITQIAQRILSMTTNARDTTDVLSLLCAGTAQTKPRDGKAINIERILKAFS